MAPAPGGELRPSESVPGGNRHRSHVASQSLGTIKFEFKETVRLSAGQKLALDSSKTPPPPVLGSPRRKRAVTEPNPFRTPRNEKRPPT
jgi:hypothetical protein